MPSINFGKARRYQVPGSGVPTPMLLVRLRCPPNETPQFLAIVDSGADVSTFHVSVAKQLGIDLSSCHVVTTQTASGTSTAYVCPVQIEVESRRFQASVHFNPDLPSTIALLGREDVFRQFLFGFDQRASHLLVQPYR